MTLFLISDLRKVFNILILRLCRKFGLMVLLL